MWILTWIGCMCANFDSKLLTLSVVFDKCCFLSITSFFGLAIANVYIILYKPSSIALNFYYSSFFCSTVIVYYIHKLQSTHMSYIEHGRPLSGNENSYFYQPLTVSFIHLLLIQQIFIDHALGAKILPWLLYSSVI